MSDASASEGPSSTSATQSSQPSNTTGTDVSSDATNPSSTVSTPASASRSSAASSSLASPAPSTASAEGGTWPSVSDRRLSELLNQSTPIAGPFIRRRNSTGGLETQIWTDPSGKTRRRLNLGGLSPGTTDCRLGSTYVRVVVRRGPDSQATGGASGDRDQVRLKVLRKGRSQWPEREPSSPETSSRPDGRAPNLRDYFASLPISSQQTTAAARTDTSPERLSSPSLGTPEVSSREYATSDNTGCRRAGLRRVLSMPGGLQSQFFPSSR